MRVVTLIFLIASTLLQAQTGTRIIAGRVGRIGNYSSISVLRTDATTLTVRLPINNTNATQEWIIKNTFDQGWRIQGLQVRDPLLVLTDQSSVWEYAVMAATNGTAEGAYTFYGMGHGQEVEASAPTMVLDGVDITSQQVGTTRPGTTFSITQVRLIKFEASPTVTAGQVTLNHQFTSAGVLVTHQHTYETGYEIFAAYGAMMPLSTNVNTIQIGTNAARTLLGDNNTYEMNTEATNAVAWHSTAHPYRVDMILPTSGPEDTVGWTLARGPEKFWLHDRASTPPGLTSLPKFYANHVSGAFAQRITAVSSAHTALYRVRLQL